MNPSCFKAIYQGDEVWFIQDESYRSQGVASATLIPRDAIVYTLAETKILAKRSESARKIAHEAKKLGGAKVTKQPGLPGLPRQ